MDLFFHPSPPHMPPLRPHRPSYYVPIRSLYVPIRSVEALHFRICSSTPCPPHMPPLRPHVLKRAPVLRFYTFLIRSYTFRGGPRILKHFVWLDSIQVAMLLVPDLLHHEALLSTIQCCYGLHLLCLHRFRVPGHNVHGAWVQDRLQLSILLYVPIRSVQPSRTSLTLLYVPIRSVYVPYTFHLLFQRLCSIVSIKKTCKSRLKWHPLLRSYTFLVRSYTFREGPSLSDLFFHHPPRYRVDQKAPCVP